ncbi:MAG: aryl-sulfate sulfotransferase, partial [Candidatus Marinimicrobia bacterium]|nr:aryl-sulfate sulfotransferase [Candidatus Neomarinimicrobiota bacterium]
MRLNSLLTKALAIGIIVVIPARAPAITGVLPVDGDTLNYTHVLFQWDQLPGAVAYQLQIAIFDTTGGADPFASDPVVDIVDSTTLAIVTDSIGWAQEYTWRIRSINKSGGLGDWGEVNNFVVDSLPGTVPDYIITINDTSAYQPGLTMTNLTRDAVMLAVDMLGEPVFFVEWGTRNIHLSEILPNGNFLTTPVEITLDNEVLWEPPEDIHHGIISLPNGNFMALGREDTLGPIPAGPWSAQYDTAGMDSVIWRGDLLIEWDHAGNEIWRWSVFDHFSMIDYDSIDFTEAFGRRYFDWTHANALSYDPVEDAIYMSVRHMDRITKIDHATGNVIWNMGKAMPSGDTRVGNDLGFSHTHAIEYLGNGRMVLYDNGNRADPQISRGLEIVVTETALDTTAEIVWEYVLPESLYTQSQGDFDRLPNGNYLITAANPTNRDLTARIFEVAPDSSIVWSLRVGENGNRSMFASERFPGLYPLAFSMIQPALATGIATPTIFVPSGAASLEFKL